MTPAGDASYRYTYNKIAGNIPLGIKKGLALVIITGAKSPIKQNKNG
jgi:hypothetical protein